MRTRMRDTGSALAVDRSRIGWWLFIAILALAAAFLAYSFVGLLVLGIFGYYATRPICQRLGEIIDSDSVAAGVTVLLVLVPIIVVAIYAGFQVFQQVQQLVNSSAGPLSIVESYLNIGALPAEQRETLTSVLRNPRQLLTTPQQTIQSILQAGVAALSAVVSTLLLVSLAIALSYFLLQNDNDLAEGLRRLFGGEDTTAYAYAATVDEDLESVFFGNLLFVIAMSAIAAVAYWGTNVLAPQELQIPLIFTLAFLTGVASLIPIVVGKIIYLPVVGYLAMQAVRTEGNQLVFVGGALVAYFLLLDILPQTFLQPYISGRHLDMMMMMFAYLLGPILFGWYGFFLLPIVFIVMLEAVRIVLPQLVHGGPITPDTSIGESIGSDPLEAREEAAAGDDDSDDSDSESDGANGDSAPNTG